MMTSPEIETEPLRTILNMESENGYADAVVIGGLDRYLVNWSRRTRSKITSPELLAHFDNLQLSDADYAAWNKRKRELCTKKILDWLAEVEQSLEASPLPMDRNVPPPFNNKLYTSSSSGEQGIDSPVTIVKGVKTNLAAKLGKLGIKTVRDLLYFFPRRYLDFSQRKNIAEVEVGEEQTVLAAVWESRIVKLGYNQGTEVTLCDETGCIRAVWFNQPYLARRFLTNTQLIVNGRVAVFKGQKVFESPEWEVIEDKESLNTSLLIPVYSLTRGLYTRQVRNLVKRVVDSWAPRITDFLSQEIRNRCQLLSLSEAITQAHYPSSYAMQIQARKRLAFDELFLLQLGVLSKKRDWQEGQPGNAFSIDKVMIDGFLSNLPYELTGAQKRVLKEILIDLQRTKPMSRLLQGDVGSGKTVIAIIALLASVTSGYQGALMAPTEILAEQHFHNISQLLSRFGNVEESQGGVYRCEGFFNRSVTFCLLTGKTSEKDKTVLRKGMYGGEIDLVIGTHALVQKGVDFNKLGLVVIDEQHRFGVLQRSALRQKGFNPHMLVMTATPIPRTLALTLYGDLDISVIEELPPGRQEIKTRWLDYDDRSKAYDFIRRQISAGYQAFIICPLVEESDTIEAKAAVAEHEYLVREVFPDLNVGLLHGRMPANEKDEVMQKFRDGRLHILVSTPVVEVGIDVPNATVMLIEAADRFGLSQLHQFRGRVGRGESKSYCLLLAERPSVEGRERLKWIEGIQDGFALAEKDLELRGPGEFFGTRQSGLPDLRMAKLSDVHLMELARNEALSIFSSDPGLESPDNHSLACELSRVWPSSSEWS